MTADPRLFARASRVVAVVALVMGSFVVGVHAAGAATGTCKVTNPRTKRDYIGAGSNLRVKGLCVGVFTVGAKLGLVGRATPAYPTPTLDGDAAGTVLTVTGGSVTVENLTITKGFVVGSGGGIDIEGALTLTDSSSVTGNGATVSGGGIYNVGSLVLTGSASVSDNKADLGGGIYNAGGTVTLRSSSVTLNRANHGGGIYDTAGGTLTLMGPSSVTGNTAGSAGGGILNNGGAVDACTTWTGAIAPNAPNDPPTVNPIVC